MKFMNALMLSYALLNAVRALKCKYGSLPFTAYSWLAAICLLLGLT